MMPGIAKRLLVTGAEAMCVEVKIVSDPAWPCPEKSEVERLPAWRPAYAGREGLERGLRATAAWFRVPGILRNYKVDQDTP